ncbi:MAG: HIT family protein [Candidatus Wildermuthbacteria bacterium]|nr:HIT family protein [Candidatus Wildermuthbacteria bacterium]
MNKDCPFCGSAREEQRTLKEGKYMHVILSNPRLMPGHLLVIPKRHVTRLSEMTKEERNELLDLLIEFEEKILSKLSAGCDIRQNYKPYVSDSRTSIKHFHFHLYPRNLNDELHQATDPVQKPLYQDLPEEEKERLFKLLGDDE